MRFGYICCGVALLLSIGASLLGQERPRTVVPVKQRRLLLLGHKKAAASDDKTVKLWDASNGQ